MELKRIHWMGIGSGLFVILLSLIFYGSNIFFLFLGVGVLLGFSPFVFSIIHENQMSIEKEEMFLEFARDLVEGVKTGTPISKSITNISNKPYGALSEHVKKLANQITIGIPLNFALHVFSKDANNKVISRALTLIGQAERAGGDIGEILESVADAVNTSDRLKKERKAVISTLVVQGYIIFFVFIIIMLVMQFKILPMVSGIANVEAVGIGGTFGSGVAVSNADVSSAFLYLLLVQGLFSGLVIGKLAEKSARAGIKHSFALMLSSFLISTIANLILG